MEVSFLITTRNRPDALSVTLNKLKQIIDIGLHEVLVFIDGCEKTEMLIKDFDWVKWEVSKIHFGASPARNHLYKKAKAPILIGLDDDAHPITTNFIETVKQRFDSLETCGIIAFQEVKGIFESDQAALQHANHTQIYETNEFIGCGFAIKNKVYGATNGFPLWMDIYGEESALSIEVLDLGYTIIYDGSIVVNHRVNQEKRKQQRKNYFRFEHQLKNILLYFLIYHPKPAKKIIKTLIHNFKKYAVKDASFFKLYIKAIINVLLNYKTIKKYRKPIKPETLAKRYRLKGLKF